MKKIIKIGILLMFLMLLFTADKTTYAESDYKCMTSCQVTNPENGPWYRQVPQEKCTGDNGEKGCGENDNNKQCCEEIEELDYKKTYGIYDMKDLLTKTINISNELLGIVGSIALLFFIIAGIKMIFSGGSEEKIGSARTMMVQTIIGLIIFLSAYLIINFVQDTLMDSSKDSKRYQLKTEEPDFKF